jgi:hypothetical protein
MKKYINLMLLTFILSIGFNVVPASKKEKKTPPDYDRIEKAVKSKKSEFYYPKLLERFKDADPSMTLEEKRHLYYGYIFQKEYTSFSSNDYMYEARELLQKKNLKTKNMQKVIELTDAALEDDPLLIRAMEYQLYMYDGMGMQDSFEFEKVMTKLGIIINAIMSSGDGLSKKSALYVIRVPDEYFMISVLGYEFGGAQSLIDHYDYLQLAENNDKVKGLYFDISPSLKHMSKMFEE